MQGVYQQSIDKISVLNAIVDVVASKDSIIDIFREVKNYLKTIIPCDYITVLFNNEETRYFYVVPALNAIRKSLQGEIIIPYIETSLTEILRAKTSIIRADLNIRGNLTPGDLKFLPPGISSDLSVPIVYKNRVKAVLNLSSYKSQTFSDHHQTIVEEVAILLSLALERIELINNFRDLKLDLNLWKDKYEHLLQNINNAIAIVGSEDDLIYETNKAFETLTGYNTQQLAGMRYSMIHPKIQNHIFNKMAHDATNGKISEFKDIILVRKDGNQISVKLRLIAASSRAKPFLFAIYQSVSQKEKVQSRDFPQLSSLLQIENQILTKNELKQTVISILDEIGKWQHAKYTTLHLINEVNSELNMFCARSISRKEKQDIFQPWLIGLNEGPFPEVITKNEMIKFEDVYSDPRFYKWLPIANKLGYRSLVCLPLIMRNKTFGVFSLFYEHEQVFNSTEILNLKNVTNYLALVIDNYHINRKLINAQQQNSVISEITSSINSSLDLEETIRTAAIVTKKVIDYDYFLITLFDGTTDQLQIFEIASSAYSKLLKPDLWNPLENTELGWVKINNNGGTKDEKLQSKLNALLLARNKYLGAITLASLEPNKYCNRHHILLEQIGRQIAIAIENAKLFQEANQRLEEFSSLSELSKSLNTSLELDQILKQIVEAVAKAMNTDFCSIRFVDGEKALPGASSTIVDAEQKGFFLKETQEFIPTIVKKAAPFYSENFKTYNSSSENKLDYPQGYKAYFGVPINSRNKVMAVLSVYWKESHKVDEREINLISTIANQAASVIENARLYKETLKSSNELKKSNEELENFVYTVSHDLKSPLVSILGFTSILLNDFQSFLNEETFHYLKRIQSNANQMEALIKDLLELSRIGRVVSPFEDVKIEEIISQVINEQIYQIEKKGIQLIVGKNLPIVYCDKKRISQVYANLIDNAIKYIGENNIEPQIEMGYKDEIDNYLFYVKDNGIGIEKQYHQQIFGLFIGLESDENSTGIGLAIVKRIIEHHGGKIWVDSEPGNGTTFFFTIPKKKF